MATGKPYDRYVLAEDQAKAEGVASLTMDNVGKVGACFKHPGHGVRCVVSVPAIKAPEDTDDCKVAAKDRAELKRRGEFNYEMTSL